MHESESACYHPILIFLERFGSFLKRIKNIDFLLYFQKGIWVGGDGFLSKKARHPGICLSFGGNVGKT